MAASSPLFSASLISPEIASSMPQGFTIRPMEKSDYAKGFVECLRNLTWMGKPTQQEFEERYDDMDTGGKGPYYYVVIEHEGKIVGTGAVIIEKKFIWNRSSCSHIEEICVDKSHQGKGLGRKIINALDSISINAGSRKSILNCSPDKESFYNKCGYKAGSMEMKRQLIEGDETES